MIDESLKTGPLPDVVEVCQCSDDWFKGRPIAYDAKTDWLIIEPLHFDGTGSGYLQVARKARPVAPRIPTDEDAKRRPKVRVRDRDSSNWTDDRTLIYVRNDNYPFVTVTNDGVVTSWQFCELIE